MQDDLRTQLEQEKLDAMKELAYGASHEINNPLANIAARAQTLLRDEQQQERRSALQAIHSQAMRAHEMISDLMLFARPPKLDIQAFDLAELLRELAKSFALQAEQHRIACQWRVPETQLIIQGDRQQLAVAISALCSNAIEAIGFDGTVDVAIRLEPQQVWLDVADSGPGISATVRKHLFDPFFSGREAGRGLGFGLSKSWRIVTDHGGTITVRSEPEEGTIVSLRLPVEHTEPVCENAGQELS
ncbi:MAG: HAMP domain-containing histidine kinase [Pirellulales bacterium]|nr:HAMP domain-containing histidine kinase [Pirellulales bacterium]